MNAVWQFKQKNQHSVNISLAELSMQFLKNDIRQLRYINAKQFAL